MRLKDIDLLKLQAWFMAEDATIQSLCGALDIEIKEVAEKIPLISEWNQLDKYDHEILDELAYEYHVDWYDSTASLDVKRRILRNSDKVHQKLGTAWAVEQVLRDYFGVGDLSEWFEYGGEPHFFRLRTTARLSDFNDHYRFFSIIEKVKRKSQWLEFFEAVSQHTAMLFCGGVMLVHARVKLRTQEA